MSKIYITILMEEYLLSDDIFEWVLYKNIIHDIYIL